MTLNQLKIFRAVGELLSVTRAARELHLSQPNVSIQMKILATELGVKLYRKHPQGIELSNEGTILLGAIRPVVQQLEEIKGLFAGREDQRNPTILLVGSTQNPSVFLLPEILKTFKENYPNINLAIRIGSSPVIEEMVLNGQIEIGVITNPSHSSKLTEVRLCSEEVVAVVSSNHPLSRRQALSKQDLTNAPVLVRMGGHILKDLQIAGLKLNISMECESSEALKAAVESGLGVGFFYRSTVASSLRTGELKLIRIPKLEGISVSSFLIHLRGGLLSPHAQKFLVLLRQCIPKLNKRVKTTIVTQAE